MSYRTYMHIHFLDYLDALSITINFIGCCLSQDRYKRVENLKIEQGIDWMCEFALFLSVDCFETQLLTHTKKGLREGVAAKTVELKPLAGW